MSRRRSERSALTVLNLPKLSTSEDDATQATMKALERADAFAGALIVVGALVEDDGSRARLAEAISALADDNECENTECSRISHAREAAAYRVGLAVGLRLARSVDGGAR